MLGFNTVGVDFSDSNFEPSYNNLCDYQVSVKSDE